MAESERGGEVIKGTLDLLVLKVLQLGPMHGWGITELIEQRSENLLSVNEGSLYPALSRLVRQGLIRSAWKTTENNRRARFYELTAAGREQLRDERAQWERLSRGVNLVLRTTGDRRWERSGLLALSRPPASGSPARDRTRRWTTRCGSIPRDGDTPERGAGNVARGGASSGARDVRRSRAAFRESAYDAVPGQWLDGLRQDLKYAVRSLRRNPGFSPPPSS